MSIATVPAIYPGAGRRVYPGLPAARRLHGDEPWQPPDQPLGDVQASGRGDEESAEATRAFYDEYRSVCDMTAEFYLQTVDVVFQRHLLPKGKFMHRGRRSIPRRLPIPRCWRSRASATIFRARPDQGGARAWRPKLPEEDNISWPANVGHYGIFNGRKWRENLEQSGRAHAAADAHRDDDILGAAALAFDQRRGRSARAGHAVGVADRDRAAVDVEPVVGDAELVLAVEHLHREGLVQLPQADVVDLEAEPLEQLGNREDRADAHFVRLGAGTAMPT
jgi:hypothetical protein